MGSQGRPAAVACLLAPFKARSKRAGDEEQQMSTCQDVNAFMIDNADNTPEAQELSIGLHAVQQLLGIGLASLKNNRFRLIYQCATSRKIAHTTVESLMQAQ
jgi:hypothetical protein